ncbi:MAG: PQQ-dependent sugar dehydrogenase, partial [Serratia marcescens]|nr:PQQ-dependent sugar dehydrogenase [Serratia marcescens]
MPRLTLLAGLLLCSGLLHAAPTVSQLQDGLEHPWSLAF